jgi:hypothetical protein
MMRTYISPNEIYAGRTVEYDEVSRLAALLNRDEALHFLGFLNLLLSAATAETELTAKLEPVREVQHWLFREIVSERLLADLKAKFFNASLLDRPLLHRTQLLFAIRLVATHGAGDGGNRLQTRSDFDVIGDLLFLINGLFATEEPKNKGMVPLWLATEMGPVYELENPPEIELAWPRIQELLLTRLPQEDPEVPQLEQVTVFTSGFGLRGWIDLTWMLFSFWGTVPYGELMKSRGRAYMDPAQNHEIVSAASLTRVVDAIGVRFEELSTHLRIDQFSRTSLFDLTRFRERPLWIMPDGKVLCVDAALLMERLGPFAFWSIMNALDTKERRRHFSGVWGNAFEAHALDALGTIMSSKAWTFSANPPDGAGSGEELADAVGVRRSSAIVVECKGTFMTAAQKYSGVPRKFFRGLTQKFGRGPHGAVYQLVRAIRHTWIERTPQTSLSKPDAIDDVFPVMVVQDPILACGPVCRVLSDRFDIAWKRASRGKTARLPRVWPLAVLYADDLDRLRFATRITGQTLDAVLKRFHRTNASRMHSFQEFTASVWGRDTAPDAAREVILTRFREFGEATRERFRAKEYGGTGPVSPSDSPSQ